MCRFKGNRKQAKKLFRQCIGNAADSFERAHVHSVAVGCYEGAEMWKTAIYHQKKLVKARSETLRTEVERTSHGNAVMGLARIYVRADRMEPADKNYKKAIKLANMPEPWVMRATDEYRRFLEKLGRVDEAAKLK